VHDHGVPGAYLYERVAEQEYGPHRPDGLHVTHRRTSGHAAQLARSIIANHDDQAPTAHEVAAHVPVSDLPDMVRRLIDRRPP